MAVSNGDAPTRTTPAWVRACDGLIDGLVLVFAGWTLFYELALSTQWSLWWPMRACLVLALPVVGLSMVLAVREGGPEGLSSTAREATTPHVADESRPTGRTVPWTLLAAAILVVLVLARSALGIQPAVVVGCCLLSVTVWSSRAWSEKRATHLAIPTPAPVLPASMHALVALACLVLAGLSSFIVKPDADDVYYVNRAAWVAEHGSPTLRDTMFSPGQLRSSGTGGLPLSSVEAWQGAMAHVLHVSAPTFAYVLSVPVLSAMAGWATWRLVRAWAPRRTLLVFLAATLFMLLSAESVIGNYSIGRIWQGKVAAVTILLPTIWFHLSRSTVRTRRRDLGFSLALGICFVGLTSTSALLAPEMAAAAWLTAIVLRSRQLALSALCLVVAPVLAGVASARGSQVGGVNPVALPPTTAFGIMLGIQSVMVAIGLLAVVLGPRLVRHPWGALAASASLAGLFSLLPGVMSAVNAVTGAGPVAWRLVLVSPTAVLVGMLAAVRLPIPSLAPVRRRPGVVVATALGVVVVVLAVLVSVGTPLWSSRVGGRLDFASWKVDGAAERDVHDVEGLPSGKGLWLLPPAQMEIATIASTRHTMVVPRSLYLGDLTGSPTDRNSRLVLFGLVNDGVHNPVVVRRALTRLGVSLACVEGEDVRARTTLRAAVRAPLRPVGSMRCHVGALADRPG